VFLRDRKADMVVSGGMNVDCREVEDVLVRHPSVGRVAVIGVPHVDWGEAVHALVEKHLELISRRGSTISSATPRTASTCCRWPVIRSRQQPRPVHRRDQPPAPRVRRLAQRLLRRARP
jgi:acyl-CoA synthetase (AMP-forming)/AMP-acid ligase II